MDRLILVRLALVSALVVLSGGCSKAPGPSPSASLSSQAEVIIRSLSQGRAHVELVGDIELTQDWTFKGGSVASDVTVITWGKGLDSFDILAMPGAIPSSSDRTSLDLWLDLLLRSKNRTFISERGECGLVLTLAQGSITGHASCDELKSEDGKKAVGLLVMFSATAGG